MSRQAAPGRPDPVFPPAWSGHQGCLMAFSAAWDAYLPEELAAIQQVQADIANAIAASEAVAMLTRSGHIAAARALLSPHVKIFPFDHDDIFVRDTIGTMIIGADGRRRLIDRNFNIWGRKFSGYAHDYDLTEAIAIRFDTPFTRAGIVAEGGAFDSDGRHLLTTESVLLIPNRNPGLARSEIERELIGLLGVEKVIWLPGSQAAPLTDGHVSSLARFVAPGSVVVEISDDPLDPDYSDLMENARRLELEKRADGTRISVTKLLRPRFDQLPADAGDDFASSYLNFYIANDGIIMPAFGDEMRDKAAQELLAAHIRRPVTALRIDALAREGGGIHRVTRPILSKPE